MSEEPKSSFGRYAIVVAALGVLIVIAVQTEFALAFLFVAFPVFVAVVVVIVVATMKLIDWLRSRGPLMRESQGLCVRCGYDLRESRDICPECGMLIIWRINPVTGRRIKS